MVWLGVHTLANADYYHTCHATTSLEISLPEKLSIFCEMSVSLFSQSISAGSGICLESRERREGEN